MSQPAFYKTFQWMAPIMVLTGIIIWMQAMPPPSSSTGTIGGASTKSLTKDDIHAFVGEDGLISTLISTDFHIDRHYKKRLPSLIYIQSHIFCVHRF